MISFVFCLQSCKKEKKYELENIPKSEIEKTEDSVNSITVSVEMLEKTLQYSITVEKIDSLQYYSVKKKTAPKKKIIAKITDINEAKKLLKGIVEFDENKDFGANPGVKKIHFRNGKKYENNGDFDYSFFIAYYPQEDILLCEGGHASDVSFNLKNGKETEETGNPDVFVFSPKENFRLNGHFGGQQCSSYFIQKSINNEYVKVIQLDEEFEKLTKIWLCIIGDSFWADEKTLFLTEDSNFGVNTKFFKVKIVEK
ncbi:hypothetical protein AXA65_14810 [Chryseobacterium sp. FP211-J200]|nr:hypothetical protein AXA65_14810 [Chryseobacterium sp. FP211-J200]